MVVNVYNSNTGYLQSAFVFAGTTGPEIANPRCFAAGFWNERRINGYCLATAFKVFSDDGFIEGKPVKVIILKIVTVCLFRIETEGVVISRSLNKDLILIEAVRSMRTPNVVSSLPQRTTVV